MSGSCEERTEKREPSGAVRSQRTSKLDLTSGWEIWQWLLPHYQERGAGCRQSDAGIPVLGTLLHRGQKRLEGRND